MARLNYEFTNFSYDEDIAENYLATPISDEVKKFNIPVNMNEFSIVEVTGKPLNITCQSTLEEYDKYQYSKKQLDKKIKAFKAEMRQYIQDMVDTNPSSSPSAGDDKIWVKFIDEVVS